MDFNEADETATKFYLQVLRDVRMLDYMQQHLGMQFDYALLTPFPDENLFDKDAVFIGPHFCTTNLRIW
mgnify:CR=1 FL=1